MMKCDFHFMMCVRCDGRELVNKNFRYGSVSHSLHLSSELDKFTHVSFMMGQASGGDKTLTQEKLITLWILEDSHIWATRCSMFVGFVQVLDCYHFVTFTRTLSVFWASTLQPQCCSDDIQNYSQFNFVITKQRFEQFHRKTTSASSNCLLHTWTFCRIYIQSFALWNLK